MSYEGALLSVNRYLLPLSSDQLSGPTLASAKIWSRRESLEAIDSRLILAGGLAA